MSDKKTEQICIRVEPETYEKLKQRAALERRSVGFLVRDMIDEWLKSKEESTKPDDRVKKRA